MRKHASWITTTRAMNRQFREKAGRKSKRDFILPHSIQLKGEAASTSIGRKPKWHFESLKQMRSTWKRLFEPPLCSCLSWSSSAANTHQRDIINVKGPLPADCSDLTQVHVLVTSRHSFKIKIQSVPTNLTTNLTCCTQAGKTASLWVHVHHVYNACKTDK